MSSTGGQSTADLARNQQAQENTKADWLRATQVQTQTNQNDANTKAASDLATGLNAENKLKAKNSGFQGTLLTSPLAISGSQPGQQQAGFKTLLGS